MNFKAKFSNLSIKNKVQYIFVVFMVITILLCSLFFLSVTRVKLRHTYEDRNMDKLNSVEKSYSAVIDNANNISKLIIVNDSVLSYLRYRNSEPDERKIRDDAVRSELYRILNSFSGNYYVYLIRRQDAVEGANNSQDPRPEAHFNTSDSDYYVNTAMGIMKPDLNEIYSEKWYDLALEQNGSYVVIADNSRAFRDNTGIETVSFARIINDIDTQKPIGLLVINIPMRELDETYSNFVGREPFAAFVDSEGKCISSAADQNVVDEYISDNPLILRKNEYQNKNDNPVVSCRKISGTDFYLICSSRFSFLSDLAKEMTGLVLGVIVILVLMLYFTSRYINKYIANPVTRLSEIMQHSETGAPVQIQNIVDSADEIGTLQKCYNDMTIRINRLLEEVVEQEKQRQRAELTVIQEQMKPHFLYNTLETIGYMALQNTRDEVYDAIETLGVFYRKFLSKGSDTITVSDEISIVKNYIKLLRLRYDDLFEDYYEIEEGLESAMIIKLILQPLVENAIYHGIRPKGEKGEIKITIYTENGRMHIKVYDTGVGMSQEQIDALLNGEDKKSFGFKGTINRIKNFYQNDVYVGIDSREGEYCEIDINIPRHI